MGVVETTQALRGAQPLIFLFFFSFFLFGLLKKSREDPYWKKDERDLLKIAGHVQQTMINALLTKSDIFQIKGVKRVKKDI